MNKEKEVKCPLCNSSLVNIEIDDIYYKELYSCNSCGYEYEIPMK